MISLLYVDDDPDVQEIALLSLALDPGLEVRPASSGAEALALLESDWVPDLLMLDMMMPDMDGPATLAAIRTRPHLTKVPAIFITARAGSGRSVNAAELGAVGGDFKAIRSSCARDRGPEVRCSLSTPFVALHPEKYLQS
jgi:CheY-like chemotaxis protein